MKEPTKKPFQVKLKLNPIRKVRTKSVCMLLTRSFNSLLWYIHFFIFPFSCVLLFCRVTTTSKKYYSSELILAPFFHIVLAYFSITLNFHHCFANNYAQFPEIWKSSTKFELKNNENNPFLHVTVTQPTHPPKVQEEVGSFKSAPKENIYSWDLGFIQSFK